MTAKTVLVSRRANALKRIESLLPSKFVETLPLQAESRVALVLEYLADTLEKRPTTKSAPKEATDVGPTAGTE